MWLWTLSVFKGKSRGSECSMWLLHIDSAWPPLSCLPAWCNCNWKYLRGRKRTACFLVAWLGGSLQTSPERMQKTQISLPRDLLRSLLCKLLSCATEQNRVFRSGGVSRMPEVVVTPGWGWSPVDIESWCVCVSVEGQESAQVAQKPGYAAELSESRVSMCGLGKKILFQSFPFPEIQVPKALYFSLRTANILVMAPGYRIQLQNCRDFDPFSRW